MAAFLHVRDVLGDFLNDLGLTGDGLEVGAYRGEFAGKVLSHWRGRTWTLLDPWDKLPPEAIHTNNTGWNMREALHACRQLVKKDSRCRLARVGSRDEESIPTPLDCVYIDALHDARSALTDLERWWPQVRPGGILAGHDYVDGWDSYGDMSRGSLFGVKTAVDHFATKHGRVVFSTFERDWPSWWFRKPIGPVGPIAVVSGSTPDVPWRDLTAANHRWYCERHSYPY